MMNLAERRLTELPPVREGTFRGGSECGAQWPRGVPDVLRRECFNLQGPGLSTALAGTLRSQALQEAHRFRHPRERIREVVSPARANTLRGDVGVRQIIGPVLGHRLDQKRGLLAVL